MEKEDVLAEALGRVSGGAQPWPGNPGSPYGADLEVRTPGLHRDAPCLLQEQSGLIPLSPKEIQSVRSWQQDLG